MSNLSQASIVELKAITAEHVERFSKEGRAPTQGHARKLAEKSKDPFARPSPGLVKRLAAEARNDAKRIFGDNEAGPSDSRRREILLAKAEKYDRIRRGDLSGLSERELAEAAIDFERKAEEYSDDSEDDEQVEYVDDLGRTRFGSKREAERENKKRKLADMSEQKPTAYDVVLQSKVLHGDQSFFPVYQPDPEAVKAKYMEAEAAARAHHYDATKEVRTRGAGQYQFALDEETRAEQMASLKAERKETETARAESGKRQGLTEAQAARKRKLDERKALVEEQRVKRLGGVEAVEKLRAERREAEAEALLGSLEKELSNAT